jgi:anthranilate phosphoribosyltransferase
MQTRTSTLPDATAEGASRPGGALSRAAQALRAGASPILVPTNREVVSLADCARGAYTVPVTTVAGLLVAACDGTVVELVAPASAEAALLRALGLPPRTDPADITAALAWSGFAALDATLLPEWRAEGHALLGALANPACPTAHTLVVREAELSDVTGALEELGVPRALVLARSGNESAGFLLRGSRRDRVELPGELTAPLPSRGAEVDARRVQEALAGQPGALAEHVACAAAAAMWTAGMFQCFSDARAWATARLAQGIRLRDLGGVNVPTRTAPSPAATNPRSPRPPRGGRRPGPDRRG